MKKNRLNVVVMGLSLLLVGMIACKDEFTESDLVEEQNKVKLEELKAQMKKDSLDYLLSLRELDYRKYLDSLRRADSLALVSFGDGAFLPYTYNLQVINGSTSSVRNGRTQAFTSDVTVSITQYGVKRTQTAQDGLFTFDNIGVGAIHGTISAPGFTSFDFVVDASLPYQFFQDLVLALDEAAEGNGAGPDVVSGSYLDILLNYFNTRSFGNDFPIFATAGNTTGTLTGRAFIETDLTNRTKEVAPLGTQVTATIDIDNAAFTDRYFLDGDAAQPTNDPDEISLNSIFNPQSWAIGYLGTAQTDANGDYTLSVPGSPDGLPIKIEYSDVISDKTFYLQSNGDVTEITRRNVYGPNMTYSTVPTITLAPTVSFFAGGGAAATVSISGDGSITDIDLIDGGLNFQGTPRVIISAPAAGGTQATATATVVNGRVTDIAIVSGGSGYFGAPAITITEGSGADAKVDFLVANAQNGGVANVVVTNSGSGYTVAPNVVFWADLNGNFIFDTNEQLNTTNFPTGINQGAFKSGTDFPAATAVFNSDALTCNCISTVNVTNSGSGMTFTPNLLITSGIEATATATIAGGVVTAVNILTNGRFYSAPPQITLPITTTGVTAILTSTLTGGTLTGITINNAGTLYADGVYALTITPAGTGATGSIVYEGMGIGGASVSAIGTLQPDNKYYTNTPRVEFPLPQYNGPGSRRATGTAVLGADGRLVGIDITDEGSGYTAAVGAINIQIISGSGASANATFANQVITEVEVTAGGDGYKVAPQVMIIDPTGAGSGATAVANLQSGRVTSIDLTNAGSGYINGATVFILDPGFTYNAATFSMVANPALANVIVTDGVISLIEVYQNGDNYPAGTEVRISSNKGNGATATATIANREVVDVVIGNGGTGYVGNNFARSLNAANNPDVGSSAPVTLFFDIYTTTFDDLFFNGQFTEYNSKSGVRRVVDIEYGTGRNQD